MSKKSSLTLFILLLAGVSFAFSGSHKLRYHLEKGKSYTYILASDMSSESEQMGQPINVSSKSYMQYTLTVDNITADGNFVCTARIDTFDQKIDSPMMPGNLPDPKEFIGKRVSITVDAKGKVIQSAAIDKKNIPTSAMMGRTPEAMLKEAFFLLPEQEVELNVPWKSARQDTINQPMAGFPIYSSTESEYSITGNERVGTYDCLRISIKAQSKRYGSGNTPQGMSLSVDAKGTTTGFILFAPTEGVMVKMDATTDMESITSVIAPQEFTSTTVSRVKATMDLVR